MVLEKQSILRLGGRPLAIPADDEPPEAEPRQGGYLKTVAFKLGWFGLFCGLGSLS